MLSSSFVPYLLNFYNKLDFAHYNLHFGHVTLMSHYMSHYMSHPIPSKKDTHVTCHSLHLNKKYTFYLNKGCDMWHVYPFCLEMGVTCSVTCSVTCQHVTGLKISLRNYKTQFLKSTTIECFLQKTQALFQLYDKRPFQVNEKVSLASEMATIMHITYL